MSNAFMYVQWISNHLKFNCVIVNFVTKFETKIFNSIQILKRILTNTIKKAYFDCISTDAWINLVKKIKRNSYSSIKSNGKKSRDSAST